MVFAIIIATPPSIVPNTMADICYPNCEQPQTRRGQERRLALLLCATDLFLEKGYDDVSLDDIVSHAGGSKPLFINTLVIKKDFLLRFVIIEERFF